MWQTGGGLLLLRRYRRMERHTWHTEPTTLVLVRHGHVADNDCGTGARLCGWTDPPLSPLACAQALRLRARLAAEPPFAAAYTSPLRRAGHGARRGW